METKKFKVIPAQSTIEWTGSKVTGSHNGTIAIKAGELLLQDGKLTQGQIVADTTRIKILDISDPATNAQFAGHLASDDFFSSEKHPEALLEIISAEGTHIKANLTIKGITNPVSFNAEVSLSGDRLTATAKVVIDRTHYDMKFRSGNFFTNLGDTLIYNDFELYVVVTAATIKSSVTVLA